MALGEPDSDREITAPEGEAPCVCYTEWGREKGQTNRWGSRSYVIQLEEGLANLCRRSLCRAAVFRPSHQGWNKVVMDTKWWWIHSTHSVNICTETRARLCHPSEPLPLEKKEAFAIFPMGLRLCRWCLCQPHTYAQDFVHSGLPRNLKTLHSICAFI